MNISRRTQFFVGIFMLSLILGSTYVPPLKALDTQSSISLQSSKQASPKSEIPIPLKLILPAEGEITRGYEPGHYAIDIAYNNKNINVWAAAKRNS